MDEDDKKMSNDIISDSLGMKTVKETTIIDVENDHPLPTTYRPSLHDKGNEIDTDTKYVRQNLYDLIEKGHRSIDELLNVADQSQHPRAYEVLATMIKTMGDMNKDLLDMHEKKQKLTGEKPEVPETVNNNLYVGSTSDLLKLLNKDDE
jgi:hypothetical protein